MVDLKEWYTVEEIIESARGVKPSSVSDQYDVEMYEDQGVWPYDDANTGYVAPAEYRDPEPAPSDIAAMMKAGGNPFVVDGKFSRIRMSMGYEAALAEQKRLLGELDEAAERAEGFLAPLTSLDTRYDYRALVEYCREKKIEPLDITIRELLQFALPG